MRGMNRSTRPSKERTTRAIAVPTTPRAISPAPKQSPMTVTNQTVAAVVTPITPSGPRRMAPAPMKPTPVRMPSGRRIRSSMTKESEARPRVPSSRLTMIIASEAARQTRIVVRIPAGRPCSSRSMPIKAPAISVSARRRAISGQPRLSGMASSFDGRRTVEMLVARPVSSQRLQMQPVADAGEDEMGGIGSDDHAHDPLDDIGPADADDAGDRTGRQHEEEGDREHAGDCRGGVQLLQPVDARIIGPEDDGQHRAGAREIRDGQRVDRKLHRRLPRRLDIGLLGLADDQLHGEDEQNQPAGDLEGADRDSHGSDDDLAKA